MVLISFEMMGLYGFVHFSQDECYCESSKDILIIVLQVLVKSLLEIK